MGIQVDYLFIDTIHDIYYRVVSASGNDDVNYNYEDFYFFPDPDDFIRYLTRTSNLSV